ncbi:TIR domain-containing protein [Micromonospora sp. DT81.3]|uniref:TIR domain-containing protein n=1 Tax=Micromonospora sp. DT81.3 TaxID=3416523 RepID=UPI003CEE7CC4
MSETGSGEIVARIPVEVAPVGGSGGTELTRAMESANRTQSQFEFTLAPVEIRTDLRIHAFDRVAASDLMDTLEAARTRVRGYHPFLVGVTDSIMETKSLTNIFGSHRGHRGLAVISTAGVEDHIVGRERMAAFFAYYLARYALTFVAPTPPNHLDTRGCIFDLKADKTHILGSMRRGALCDACRQNLVTGEAGMSTAQYGALDDLFGLSGELLTNTTPEVQPRIFVGSSSEGLPVANTLQELLGAEYWVEVWNQGAFGLGSTTLEALEDAVESFDFGVFVFTPDDEVLSRGGTHAVARDNVIFEAGMFVGRLGRKRALVVEPGTGVLALPTDLLGLTTARYDASIENLSVALGPTANRIRTAVKAAAALG